MSEIEVHADLGGATHRVGTLRVTVRRGRNTATFTYEPTWRDVPGHYSLEPALMVGEGQFATEREREMFASIGDSAPDTWGRRLMRRMERRRARSEGRAPPPRDTGGKLRPRRASERRRSTEWKARLSMMSLISP